jgi:uncharacterized protein (DUF885 family)
MIRTARLLLAGILAAAPCGVIAQQYSPDDTSEALNRMFQEYAVASRPLFPMFATANGWRQYDGQFTNELTEEHREAHRRYCRSGLERLQEFDRSRLNWNDQLSYDVFRHQLIRCLDRLEFDLHLLPIDQGGNNLVVRFPIWGAGKGPQPFRNVTDYENFLKRIAGFVEWMDTAIANMRRGMATGFVQPRAVMEKVLPQLNAMIVDDARKSPFYEPVANMPEEIGGENRRRLAEAYETAIRTQIVPAYRRVRDFVRDEYLPKTRTTAGLSGLPGGDKLYAYLVRTETTTRLTPDEIFELGKREIARLWKSMEALKAASGYSGRLQEWAVTLRDERTTYSEGTRLIAAYNALHDRVYPRLSKLFGRLPEASYEVRAMEAYREQSASHQYWRASRGRPAIFYLNLRSLKKTPMGASVPLFLHETLPGHHLQQALAQENRDLPNFRRVGHWQAYVEGWAVYAEDLGFDMGLYGDPYEHLNKLAGDQHHAARLVTDVGLHVKGWSRERAIAFVRENTLAPHIWADFEAGAASSIERQMAWPAFALGYKIGQLKFHELRRRAEIALKDRFDLRAFHDEVLKDGALPLDILEAKIDRWIAAEKR